MKNKKRINPSLLLFFFYIILSSSFILSYNNFSKLKEGVLTGISFFQEGLNKAILFSSQTINSVGELRDLKKKYDLLKKENTRYRGIEREFIELKRENVQLKDLLDFNLNLGVNSVPCEIIGKDPSNLSSAITINKGTKDGITKNMVVVAEQNGMIGLVGKIITAGYSSSVVITVLDERNYIAARLTNSRNEGLVNGSDSINLLELKYVKKIAFDDIKVGDLVETSGMMSIYPKGYFIGRIASIKEVEYDTSLLITVKPIIDFSKIEFISVLKPEVINEEK